MCHNRKFKNGDRVRVTYGRYEGVTGEIIGVFRSSRTNRVLKNVVYVDNHLRKVAGVYMYQLARRMEKIDDGEA